MKKQIKFTTEFADEAVALARTSGRTRRQIASDLGIGLSTLARWIRERHDREVGTSGAVCSDDMSAEIKRLRRDIEVLRQERDILKKATVFFAKEGSR